MSWLNLFVIKGLQIFCGVGWFSLVHHFHVFIVHDLHYFWLSRDRSLCRSTDTLVCILVAQFGGTEILGNSILINILKLLPVLLVELNLSLHHVVTESDYLGNFTDFEYFTEHRKLPMVIDACDLGNY